MIFKCSEKSDEGIEGSDLNQQPITTIKDLSLIKWHLNSYKVWKDAQIGPVDSNPSWGHGAIRWANSTTTVPREKSSKRGCFST